MSSGKERVNQMHEPSSASKSYLTELNVALAKFPTQDVERVSELILKNRAQTTLFVAGNGGSATTASHMATDLGVGSLKHGFGIRVIGLTDNQGIITATANDLSYDQIFSEQLRLLAKKDDLFLAFSASGNSQNLVNAFTTAQQMQVKSIAITGFDGGTIKTIADYSIHVQTNFGSYGVVEDIHSVISHLITRLIRENGS